jgi:hypothetical protein
MWLSEAAIEMAMILAVAVGGFMLVAAVWSLIHERLHPKVEHPREQAPEQRATASELPRMSSGRPA